MVSRQLFHRYLLCSFFNTVCRLSLQPNSHQWRFMPVYLIRPIRVAFWCVISFAILTPSVSCCSFTLNSNCHTVIVVICVTSSIVVGRRIGASQNRMWTNSKLVLIAHLVKKFRVNVRFILEVTVEDTFDT